MHPTDMQEQIAEFVRRYRFNTARMVRELFGIEPDDWQVEAMAAFDRRDRRISVASGHGVGKTGFLAWCSINVMLTESPWKIAATAPVAAQMFDAYFAEVETWVKKLPDWLVPLFNITTDRIEFLPSPSDCFLSAQTARPETPEALAGKHSPGMVLLIADEASGVHNKVFEAAAGSMSGHNCVTILAGNPVRDQGYFFDTHHEKREGWTLFRVDCEQSKLVSKLFVAEMEATYGRDSNEFRVRVSGLFPKRGENTIISRESVDAARKRDIVEDKGLKPVWGLDVARTGGDRCVLTVRRGHVVHLPEWWSGQDTMQTVARVLATWEATLVEQRPEWIFVDVIGIGAGVVDRLRELGLPVRGINVAESAAMNEKYANLRAELWFRVQEWLLQGAARLPDADRFTTDEQKLAARTLANELCAVRYDYTPSLKLQVEDKKAMKKRGVRSPDFADSLVLTFAGPAATAILGGKTKSWAKPLKRGLKGVV